MNGIKLRNHFIKFSITQNQKMIYQKNYMVTNYQHFTNWECMFLKINGVIFINVMGEKIHGRDV